MKFKKVLVAGLVATVACSAASGSAGYTAGRITGIEETRTLVEETRAIEPGFDYYLSLGTVYEAQDLTEEILIHRNGSIIIERCVGICRDDEGHGRLINGKDYNYISYNNPWVLTDISAGDLVVTYCVYNPENNAPDDIIERYDFVVGHEEVIDNET